MSYEREEIEEANCFIYPVNQLMNQGLSSINELIIEHMKGKIDNDVIVLLEDEKYSQAFDLLDELGLSETFDQEYLEWYQENEEDVIMTLFDRDSYHLRNDY